MWDVESIIPEEILRFLNQLTIKLKKSSDISNGLNPLNFEDNRPFFIRATGDRYSFLFKVWQVASKAEATKTCILGIGVTTTMWLGEAAIVCITDLRNGSQSDRGGAALSKR